MEDDLLNSTSISWALLVDLQLGDSFVRTLYLSVRTVVCGRPKAMSSLALRRENASVISLYGGWTRRNRDVYSGRLIELLVVHSQGLVSTSLLFLLLILLN